MPKYINAEKVHGNCHFCKKEGKTCFDKRGSHRYCWEFDENFAADVVEVKRGKWERRPDPYGFFDDIPVCSECGCTTKYREETHFCPHCGADMRRVIK